MRSVMCETVLKQRTLQAIYNIACDLLPFLVSVTPSAVFGLGAAVRYLNGVQSVYRRSSAPEAACRGRLPAVE